MFLKRKKETAKHDIWQDDCKIVIYSTKNFLETFSRYVALHAAELDAEEILENSNESNRINALIKKFDEVANTALLNTIVITGYKREDKKRWKIWKWFS